MEGELIKVTYSLSGWTGTDVFGRCVFRREELSPVEYIEKRE